MCCSRCFGVLFLIAASCGLTLGQEKPAIKLLFLGDNGHHRPADRFAQLKPVMTTKGIEVTYTDKVTDLNPKTLAAYDGLIIYANTTQISPEQEQALLDYVAGGKGFIPLHCASYCFLNSPKYIELVGAQFRRHGTGVFHDTVADTSHPIMRGFGGFESWDETYVHHQHNEKDRTVLAYRVDADGREPWTWVRTHGKGRVFYTAWGHDQRTWGHAGFQNLLERGIRWAVGQDPSVVPEFTDQATASGGREPPGATTPFPVPTMTPPRTDVKPFEYVDAKIAYYPPTGQRRGDGGWNKMQLPLEPEESLKHYRTPVGFHVELFASEPEIGKPICMAWDERGRLWIAETVDYPNEMQREGEGRDRIKICEDTNGDGKADKFTIFAEKLSIPTSLCFARGGVIVHQAPVTLFLKDADGDDHADTREVLFRGWGTRDTHAGPSNMVYGLDNWIWGMVGYSGFNGTVGGEDHRFSQGFYRFKPDGSKLEFLRSTNNNTWGIGISEEGLVFGSTANRNPSVYLPIPNRYYERVRGWSSSVLGTIADTHLFHAPTEKIRQVDHHGGYTAAAGHALYTARAYPQEYWNRTAFVAEPTGHLVGVFILNRDGADFKSTNPFNLLASDDEWAAPIMAEVGPDGQVWVIDWYNYIVQHNPTPTGYETGKGAAYETPLRDKKHGRIYRIVYDKARSERLNLASASPEKLVETLKHDNLFWRRHAQRLLVERGKPDVVDALAALTKDAKADAIGQNAGVVHALWTMQGLGANQTATALKHSSAGARRNALAVLPRTSESLKSVLDARLLADPDAQVREAALLALSEMPSDAVAGEAILAAINQPENAGDHWLPDAATSAAAAHDLHFLKAVISSAELGSKSLEITAIVAEHYARRGPLDTVGPLVATLADAKSGVADAVIGGLARGWPRSQSVELSADAEATLAKLLPELSTGGKGQLIRLATLWGSKALEKHGEEIAAAMLASAADSKQRDSARAEAARQFIQFRSRDDQAIEQVLAIISPRTSPEAAAALIESLGGSQASGAGKLIAQRLPALAPSARAAALRVLISRAEWTEVLLDELRDGKLPLGELTLEQKQALASHPNRQIANRAKRLLEQGGGLPNADRQKVLEELLPLTEQVGDATAGKEIFKKTCAKCHTHSGEGTKIGPDLTGMAVHPKKELLTHIIDPSRNVEGNYRVYTVVMSDGRIMNGLLASESRTSIELFDAEGKKHAVLREDIEDLQASNKSLMPEGFEKQVQPPDVVNLLEFLTTRGKFLPLPLEKAATIVSTRGMFYSETAEGERMIFADWSPKTFAGVPFVLVDPQGDRARNCILLYGPNGKFAPQMPRNVKLVCNSPAKAIHLLSGVSGWGYPYSRAGSTSMIVRLHYADGSTEDHPLKNGEHFADYIRRVDVPGSQFAFQLRGQQLRYLSVQPQRADVIQEVELVKGDDQSAPIVMAVTVETK